MIFEGVPILCALPQYFEYNRQICMKETFLQNKNILVELNTLVEGLNFLVPTEWWDQVISKSPNLELKQLQSGKLFQHPLSVLLELGVLEIDQKNIERQLQSINQKAFQQAMFMNSKAEQVKQMQKGSRKGFSNYLSTSPNQIIIGTTKYKVVNQQLYKQMMHFPISDLLEMGVLQMDQDHTNIQLKTFNQKTVNSKSEHQNQVAKGNEKCFANFQSLNLGKITKQSQFDHILICPRVNNSALENMMIDVVWKVINPSLYSIICHYQTSLSIQKSKKSIIGIPVFLDSSDIDYTNPDAITYDLRKQVNSNISFHEGGQRKYAMIGSLQYKLNAGRISQYIVQGLNRLFPSQTSTENTKNRQILYYHKDSFYRQQELRNNNKQIVKNFVQLYDCKLVEPFQMIFFIGAPIINILDQPDDELQLHQLQKPSKKLKVDELLQAKYKQTTSERKTFQPTIINDSNSKYGDKYYRFNNLIHRDKNFMEKLKQTKEKGTNRDQHSSTQQDTPSVILQQALYEDCMRLGRKQENKISFPLWKTNLNVNSFIKSAELKMNESISVPFCKYQGKTVKINGGKRVYVGGRSNKISMYTKGQLIQEQLQQQKGINAPIPEDILKSLEGLALQILGQRNIELFNKQQAVQLLKDKVDIESQTCKNDMDDLDEAESRQC